MFGQDPIPDLLADPRWRHPQSAQRAADIDECLVETQWLDQRRDFPENGQTACGHSRRARDVGMAERTP